MKYRVRTHELHWYYCYYIVEANSEEEAQELAESGFGDFEYSDYDTTDQVDIESVKVIEEEN